MKTLRSTILLALALASPFYVPLLFTGCSTTNPAGRLLASSVQTVDAAMQGWWSYEVLGHATPDQVALARQAYADYQAAEALAEIAYVEFAKTGDESAWQRAADGLRASQGHLLQLIEQFQKKDSP